ncbi:hypothetical protein ACFONJ_11430 [Chryseobacterium tructae]|jgi:hypothetical protein|uniref:GLPGLI family protein n=2 Tax=Chryseobacterium tructae TaxID=1037380 RepID=A0ABV7XXI3_9FLAO
MERKLPTILIEGTEFIIDVNRLEFREKADERNILSLHLMKDIEGGYQFSYGLQSKNTPNIWTDEKSITVKIPELVELDPLGMSTKYKIPLEQLRGKTDFEIMVNQYAFDRRMEKGQLPTIDIAGEIFQVELDKDKLIPKADPFAHGIDIPSFGNPDHIIGDYTFAYDPIKREIVELDYLKILELPKDLIAINLPYAFRLDPIGWNINLNRDPKWGLKTIDFKMEHQSPKIPWEKTDLPEIIKENLEELRKKQAEQKKNIPQQPTKKGRRM